MQLPSWDTSSLRAMGSFCKMTPTRDPKPGWAYRTSAEGGNPELRNFILGFSTKLQKKTNFIRGFSKNPSVESVAGEQTQFFTEGFPVIFHEGPFPSWNRLFSCWFYLLVSNSEPNVCQWGACGGLGVAWKDSWCPRALIWRCDLTISSHYIDIWAFHTADMGI